MLEMSILQKMSDMEKKGSMFDLIHICIKLTLNIIYGVTFES